MKLKFRNTTLIMGIVLTGLMFAFGGCTRYANQDDLDMLENQRQAALSAESRIEELEGEKSNLEREIADKERELEGKKDILDAVQ